MSNSRSTFFFFILEYFHIFTWQEWYQELKTLTFKEGEGNADIVQIPVLVVCFGTAGMRCVWLQSSALSHDCVCDFCKALHWSPASLSVMGTENPRRQVQRWNEIIYVEVFVACNTHLVIVGWIRVLPLQILLVFTPQWYCPCMFV